MSEAEAVKEKILANLVTEKGNACPMGVRLAWHSAGTYDKSDNSGGTNGGTMRFEPESTDDANAGLDIARNMMENVKKDFPNVSFADIYAPCGAAAVEYSGGPKVPVGLGRSDEADGSKCPANGRLPDASLGADHLREVFYRMGFDDKEIVCLSGAHTLGRCHTDRSGFDGPWTADPLKFDNTYFTNLLELEWKPREWDGPLQYADPSGELMMLPTDLCLIQDEKFLPYVKHYASDADAFSQDFAKVFAKLLALGCPADVAKAAEA
jgi:catalase (peroxidase I)